MYDKTALPPGYHFNIFLIVKISKGTHSYMQRHKSEAQKGSRGADGRGYRPNAALCDLRLPSHGAMTQSSVNLTLYRSTFTRFDQKHIQIRYLQKKIGEY